MFFSLRHLLPVTVIAIVIKNGEGLQNWGGPSHYRDGSEGRPEALATLPGNLSPIK